LKRVVVNILGEKDAVLCMDETGFLKKQTLHRSPEAYSDTAGCIENCQIGIFLSYASAKGHAFLEQALSLPTPELDK
jgi:SRSO17 transposase